MSKKEIYIKNIGNIILSKSKRAKRLTIRVKPFKGVFVTMPASISFKYAEKFVAEKKEWIKKSLLEIEKIEDKKTVFENNSIFKTKKHRITFKSDNVKNINYKKDNFSVLITYPYNINVRDEEIQKIFYEIIEDILRMEAKELLPPKVLFFAERYKFKFAQIKIQNSKTRWGSCSAKNNINLSLHLMKLPDYLIDYVILHELCHTVEKNHGKNFWKLLDNVSGNAKGLSKELRNFSAKIH